MQQKVNNFGGYIFAFIFLCSCLVTLISSHSEINKIGIMFAIVALPLGITGLTGQIFRPDLEDGYLENLLSNFTGSEIVLTKFTALFLCGLAGIIFNLPILTVVFTLKAKELATLSIIMVLLLISSASILMLIASIQSYFRSNTNILAILVIPLLVPSIILAGIALEADRGAYLFIMLGIDLILWPISMVLSAVLIKNIYNI